MAPTKKGENVKQITKTQKQKAKNKSKYFDKTKNNRPKRAGKNITKQTKAENDETDKKNPNFEPNSEQLSCTAVNGSAVVIANPRVFGNRLDRNFFDTPTETLAVSLLGKMLCRKTGQGVTLCGRIVETESYLGTIDPACHAYGGKRTPRVEPMYAPPGTAYVYFIYGMYYCFNISSKEDGACVLIRGLEPLIGLAHMRELRSAKRKETSKPLKDHELANGPSKLCTALDITKDKLNTTDMVSSNQFWVEDTSLTSSEKFTVIHTTRIGIDSYGTDAAQKLYRYYILGNKNVSVRDKVAESKL